MSRPPFLVGPPHEPDPARGRTTTLDWAPLERIVAPSLRGDFMFMGRGHSPNGDVICIYKHRMTREHLNIDARGQMYRYLNGTYIRLDANSAVETSVPALLTAIARGEPWLASPESPCDATQS